MMRLPQQRETNCIPRPTQCPQTEPYEHVLIDVDDAYSGGIIERMAQRKAALDEFSQLGPGKVRLTFKAPSRGLIGFQSELKTETRGSAIMHRVFDGYGAYVRGLDRKQRSVLVSQATGAITAYALDLLQARGTLFVRPGDPTYVGHIIGECSRDSAYDMDVNPVKGKKLTNVRAAGNDEAVRLPPPRTFPLEEAIVYVASDELVEVRGGSRGSDGGGAPSIGRLKAVSWAQGASEDVFDLPPSPRVRSLRAGDAVRHPLAQAHPGPGHARQGVPVAGQGVPRGGDQRGARRVRRDGAVSVSRDRRWRTGRQHNIRGSMVSIVTSSDCKIVRKVLAISRALHRSHSAPRPSSDAKSPRTVTRQIPKGVARATRSPAAGRRPSIRAAR